MHKKIPIVVGITILFLGTCITPSVAIDTNRESYTPISNGKTLYVGGTGEGNYTKIQDAIDDATDGDTVFVYDESSPYYENIMVDKSINLIGENKDTTVIDGSGSKDVVNIYSDYVDINGFTIQNDGNEFSYNVRINIYSQYNTISYNDILNIGIYLNDSGNNNNIIGNNINSNIPYSDNGIYLRYSRNNTIISNSISNIYFCGIRLFNSNNNYIEKNNIFDNGQGLFLLFSDNNTLTDNTYSKNDYGIIFSYSYRNYIIGNSISNNINGTYIYNSDNNTLADNDISNNNKYGILLYDFSYNNIIYHNNFKNNIDNAIDRGNNIWDDEKKGNYWSDYKERYPNASKIWWKGIWDTPYEIEGGENNDSYPLIRQWRKSSSSTTAPRIKIPIYSLFLWFLERFPLLEKLLNLVR